MGCVYTGSAGGAIVIDTPNCANEMAGMASIRKARNNKRILRILNHLARSSFGCPVLPCCCGLRGTNGHCVDASIPRRHREVCVLLLTFRGCSHQICQAIFPEMTVLAQKKAARAQTLDPRRE